MDDARHTHDADCDGSWVEREALARAAGTPLPKRGGRRREVDMPGEDEVRAAVRTLIRWTGDNPEREGLVDTPDRVMRSYREMYAGYDVDPREYLERTFEEVGGYDELIVLRDIRFVSVCEHHMLPVIGKAHVAYLPTDRVVGISKLARVVRGYALRLQHLLDGAGDLGRHLLLDLQPQGVGVVIEAEHSCMTLRGVNAPGTSLTTSHLLGVIRDDARTREEFLRFVRG